MVRVSGLDAQRLIGALILLVMALFVAGGAPGAGRWRRPLRVAAMIGFTAAVALALGETVRWLAGGGR